MELLTGFLRRLVAERARADYDVLVDSFASGVVSMHLLVQHCMRAWERSERVSRQASLLMVSAAPFLGSLQRSTAGGAPTMWTPSQTCSRWVGGRHSWRLGAASICAWVTAAFTAAGLMLMSFIAFGWNVSPNSALCRM